MSERRDSIGPYRVRSPAGAEARSEYFVAVPQNGAFQSVILRRTPIAAFDSEASLHEYTNAVKLYATLSHSALVQIYEVFTHSGAIVVALEHVEGRSLRDFMNDALLVAPRLPDAAAFFAGLRVFGALAAAHGARGPGSLDVTPVVHGAVRPENILVPWDGYVRLAEFRASQCAMVWRPSPVPADSPYQAPEVKRGDAATAAGDIFSAARVLWELLRGPHASAPPAIRGVMVGAPVERLSVLRRDLPKKVTESLDICLSPKPEDRTLSAAQMLSILRSAFVPEEGEQWFISTIARLRSAPILQGLSGIPAGPVDSGDKAWSEQVKVSQDSVGLFAWTGEQAVASDDAPTSEASTVVTDAKGGPVAPRPATKPGGIPPSGGTSAFNVALGASVPPGETRSSPRPPPNVGFDPADLVPSVLPSAFPQYTSVKPVGAGLGPMPVPQGIVQVQMGQASAPPAAPPKPAAPEKAQAPGGGGPNAAAGGPAPAGPAKPAAAVGPGPAGAAKAPAAGAKPAAQKQGSSVALFAGAGLVGALLIGGAGYFAWSQGVFTKKPVPMPSATVTAATSQQATAAATPSTPVSVAPTVIATVTPSATASAMPSASASATPSASATSVPSGAPSAGVTDAEHTVLNTQGAPAGHRVYFDGRVLGEPPNPFTVRCGRHEIRIGSKGAPRNVDLPCGGEYALK